MPDVGLTALDTIHKLLFIDEPWTIRGERDGSVRLAPDRGQLTHDRSS